MSVIEPSLICPPRGLSMRIVYPSLPPAGAVLESAVSEVVSAKSPVSIENVTDAPGASPASQFHPDGVVQQLVAIGRETSAREIDLRCDPLPPVKGVSVEDLVAGRQRRDLFHPADRLESELPDAAGPEWA